MKSVLILSSESADAGRLRDVGELLVVLRESPWAGEQIDIPEWLDAQFRSHETADAKARWLAEWRNAGPGRRRELEAGRGWEREQWLYWFSPENSFWRVGSVQLESESSVLTVHISHDDDPMPLEAIRWLATAAGVTLSDIRRIE